MLSKPATYVKALLAAATTALSALMIALDDGSMTQLDGVKVAAAALAAFTAVYAIPNEPTAPPAP